MSYLGAIAFLILLLENCSSSITFNDLKQRKWNAELQAAVEKMDIESLNEEIKNIDSPNSVLNSENEDGEKLINIASAKGCVAIVDRLIELGADIEGLDDDDATPLSSACQNGQENVVAFLLEKEACVNVELVDGRTPLFLSSEIGNENIVKMLLGKGADLEKGNVNNETPLYIASKNNRLEVVELLMKAGANRKACSVSGINPMCAAIENDSFEAFALLLKQGLYEMGDDNWNPLCIASLKGNAKIVDILLESGAKVDCKSPTSKMPIHLASMKGHSEVILRLLSAGAQPNAFCSSRHCALHASQISPLLLASEGGHTNAVKVLLGAGADPNLVQPNGITPLWVAALNGHAETAEKLVDAGAEKDVCCNDYNYRKTAGKVTPLLLACASNNVNMARVLLKSGCDPNKQGDIGYTPLIIAVQKNFFDLSKLILESGADVNKTWAIDGGGQVSALACVYTTKGNAPTDSKILKLLIDMGGDVGVFLSKEEGNLIHMAADTPDFPDGVKLLIEQGIDLDVTNASGETALYIASKNGRLDYVKLLLEAGAKPRVAIAKDVVRIAKSNGHDEVARFIKDYIDKHHKLSGLEGVCFNFGKFKSPIKFVGSQEKK